MAKSLVACLISPTLPSSCTTGKPTYAECPDICRVHNLEHSAKILFAECQKTCTRRINNTRRTISLPSASHMALGKDTLCRVLVSWHSAKSVTCTNTRPADVRYGGDAFVCRVPTWGHSATRSLPSALQSTLGKRCHVHRTRQLPKAVTLLPRTFPFFHGRYRYASPSAKLGHSANIL